MKTKTQKWFRCPVCLMGYGEVIRKAGQRCGDSSQGQKSPCVGRMIPEEEFKAAEWIVSLWHVADDPRRNPMVVR